MTVLALRVALVLSLFAGVTRGDEASSRRAAKQHYDKGRVAYELGHYDVAIAEYEAAYSLYSEPSLLYNLGQANRLAGRVEEALHFYKMYLSKVPDAPNRSDVEKRIEGLAATLDEQRRAATHPPLDTKSAIPEKAAPVAANAATAARAEAPVARSSAPPNPAPARRPLRGKSYKISGSIVAVAGAGLVAGGIAAGLGAKSAADGISEANARHQPYDPGKYARYQTDLIVAGVLTGIGAAAALTGMTLSLIGARRDRRAASIRVSPSLSPAHVGAALTVQF